jgi:PAS domain S-box-containing protein
VAPVVIWDGGKVMDSAARAEESRLAALRRYEILDTPPDGAFDRITALAARLFDVPIAIISLVDTDRIWFKSHHGIDVEQIERAPGLCASAIMEAGPTVLTDAATDLRALANPLVAGAFGLRFYAGVPLRTSDGYNLGTLCVIDRQPREVSDDELAALTDLANLVIDQMELRLAARRAVNRSSETADALSQQADLARAAERQLNAVLDNASVAVFRMDERQHCVYMNAAAERMTGYTIEETTGRPLHDVIHHTRPDGSHFPLSECAIDRAFPENNNMQGEEVFVHKDGSFYPVAYTASPIRDGESNTIGTIIEARDITAEKRVLAALDDQARHLETLNRTGAAVAAELELSRVVQIVTDAGVELTGAQFGAFFYNVADDTGASMLLYTLSGADRSQFDSFGHPRPTPVFAPTFKGEGVIRSDDITKDPRYGKNPPNKGMPTGHLPVRSYLAVPVTSRSGEVIGGLFFGHPDPGLFDEASEQLMLGLAGQAAIAIDNARLYESIQKANLTLEERVRERTRELEEAHEALRQAQKMEAIGQLTGGIAHDFNNLLTGISGSLELIERRLAEGRTQGLERFISGAQTSAQRAAALTQRLLAFSRRQTLDAKPTDVNRLVLGMEDLIHRTVGPGIKVEVIGAAGLWTVKVDAAQLESALLNLAINGRDAMPNGGRLTIETANKWIDARAGRERDLPPGQYISICVSDTGTGIPKDIVERIFDPFFTTKPIGQGTGLGLSMIHGFMRQSGGQVRVYSEPGEGTTMCLYLPRHTGDLSDDADGVDAAIAKHGAGETVLVIEDEPIVRLLIVEVLEEAGYTALEAEDGPSGLKILNSGAPVDLLITDVGLPGGMNGRQVADAARVSRPDLKILFVTGFAANAAVSGGLLEPGMAVVTKPFVMTELANTITEMIERKG